MSSACGQWFVFGVDSFGEKLCGHYGDSNTAYISTVHHRKWILEVSNESRVREDLSVVVRCVTCPCPR